MDGNLELKLKVKSMNTKIVNICLMFFVACMYLQACTEEPVGQQPTDSVAPGEVTSVTARRTAGGAVFHYVVPKDEDVLYVKAEYSLNDGEKREVRASLYVDSLEIIGFGDTLAHQVQLIAVDRSKNESNPVSVTIKPLSPPLWHIGETLRLEEDFGGIHAYWENPSKANISVFVMTKDKNDDNVPLETFYSAAVSGEGSVRGLDTIPVDVTTYVQDRWGNKSEIKSYTLTPIYETQFDRNLFRALQLANDTKGLAEIDYIVDKIFDGVKNDDPCFSSNVNDGWPQWISIDLGITGKLSRLRLYQRMAQESYTFNEGNPSEFEIWGCLDTPAASGDWSSWTKLADCVSVKPSGLPVGNNSDEDVARARDGEDFTIPIDAPPVHYLRILVKRTWANGSNFQISEIELFGDNR
jgi:hypothetical protein